MQTFPASRLCATLNAHDPTSHCGSVAGTGTVSTVVVLRDYDHLGAGMKGTQIALLNPRLEFVSGAVGCCCESFSLLIDLSIVWSKAPGLLLTSTSYPFCSSASTVNISRFIPLFFELHTQPSRIDFLSPLALLNTSLHCTPYYPPFTLASCF